MQFYSGLKGLSYTGATKIELENRLKTVRLSKAADRVSRSYSGGMRRRLSVVISSIGDPKILFLDEPTTGMVCFKKANNNPKIYYRIPLTDVLFGPLLKISRKTESCNK